MANVTIHDETLDEQDREIAGLIAELGSASEVELQARTLKGLKELRGEIGKLEKQGLVRRRHNAFPGGFGDALTLTEKGYKSIR